MRTALLRLTTLAAVVVSLSPPVLRAQEGIFVTDFAGTAPQQYSLAGPAKIRRGVTSTVQIVKNLIDLVPFDQIKVHSGPTTIAQKTNGRTSSGTGFIQFTLIVPPGPTQQIGSTITIDVGFFDHFNFTVERMGMIANPQLVENPATVVAGTQIHITVAATDIGTPEILMHCHSATINQAGNSFTATVTRLSTPTCSSTNGPFTFGVHGTAPGDPSVFATSAGVRNFPFPAYLVPPPPLRATCASVPGIGRPLIVRPLNQQVIEFPAGATARQEVAVVWGSRAEGSQVAPNNDWIVTLVGATPLDNRTQTVRDTVFQHAYPLPGTYTVTVRARNCDTDSPSSSVSFQLKFQ
jgi:hypothetical protein